MQNIYYLAEMTLCPDVPEVQNLKSKFPFNAFLKACVDLADVLELKKN